MSDVQFKAKRPVRAHQARQIQGIAQSVQILDNFQAQPWRGLPGHPGSVGGRERYAADDTGVITEQKEASPRANIDIAPGARQETASKKDESAQCRDPTSTAKPGTLENIILSFITPGVLPTAYRLLRGYS